MNIKLIKDKIRIDKGGASWSVHLLATELTNRGHDVELITVHFTGVSNNAPDDPVYTLTERPLENYTQADGAARTYELLTELVDPDLIHSFQPQLNPVLGAWKSQNPEVATVGRLNSYENFCTNHALIKDQCYKDCTVGKKWKHHPNPSIGALPKMAFDTWAQPTLLNKLDALFGLSPAVAEIFEGYGVDENRIKVIPNFYEESFGNRINREYGNNQDYRAVYVGRLVEKKGVHVLCEAVKMMEEKITVDIVGDGPAREKLTEQAPSNVTFHGFVDHDDVVQYYKRADVFVHPGLWPEPFGRTVLEAMQCDCIPVVSDVGAPPWIIGDAGLTFPKGNVDSLKSRLDQLAPNTVQERYRREIPNELERFHPSSIVDRVEREYLELKQTEPDHDD